MCTRGLGCISGQVSSTRCLHLRDSRRSLRRRVRGAAWGSVGVIRDGIPMGADPACLRGSGACRHEHIMYHLQACNNHASQKTIRITASRCGMVCTQTTLWLERRQEEGEKMQQKESNDVCLNNNTVAATVSHCNTGSISTGWTGLGHVVWGNHKADLTIQMCLNETKKCEYAQQPYQCLLKVWTTYLQEGNHGSQDVQMHCQQVSPKAFRLC